MRLLSALVIAVVGYGFVIWMILYDARLRKARIKEICDRVRARGMRTYVRVDDDIFVLKKEKR